MKNRVLKSNQCRIPAFTVLYLIKIYSESLIKNQQFQTREFEKELAHIRDEFERLRLAYEGTRATLEAMEVGFKHLKC
jgi:hypothetical protein